MELPLPELIGSWLAGVGAAVMRETGLRPGTLQRLRAPDDYRSGAAFLKIRAEADKARYEREVPLTVRAREVLDEVCPNEGLIFPKFAWRRRRSPRARASAR